MSILIKGMAMPKNCAECPCYYDGYCQGIPYNEDDEDFCEVSYKEYDKKRRDDCPLIELPPHGDLIDRDALMKDGWLSLHKEVIRMGGYAIHELPLINPTIPVVIEKENC